MEHWKTLKSMPGKSLVELFEQNADRASDFGFEQSGLFFDFPKTHLDAELLQNFGTIATEAGLAGKISALLTGDIVNPSEGRAAEHTAERGVGADTSVENAQLLRRRMTGLINAVEEGAFGEVEHIIHLGIGGSALGPQLVLEALGIGDEKYETSVISNIDGCALEPILERSNAEKTLLVIASKSFTTTETFINAQSVLDWMTEQGVGDPTGRVVALTAMPEKAVEWGIDESRVLPFSETIGGRYSIWSSIGFSIALTLGIEVFEDFLNGAAEMDRHFSESPFEENLPVLAAFCDQYYAQARECETRAVFAYDERLRLLPDYLQQLEMESNGKSVSSSGEPLKTHSSPIVWGGVGTDAQHAVFQLLHQGTHLVPTEFLAVIEPGHSLGPDHHEGLLLSCFAQGAALMSGKQSDDPNRNYPGGRPSVTILLERLEARTLGILLAFYEHRTFVNAVLLGINPFDQFGVELGKEMARKMSDTDGNKLDPSTEQLKKAGVWRRVRQEIKMPEFDYDLFVIGGGSGGVRAARISATHGAKVALAEEYRMGGTCVIRGCVPKKMLVYGSQFAEDLHEAERFGWDIEGAKFDWPRLRDIVQDDVDRLEGLYGDNLGNVGVEIIKQRAVLTGPNEIKLADGKTVTAKYILVATGGWPAKAGCEGEEHALTSNEIFHLEEKPERIIIVGGGYIANEFAGIFHAFGSDVTVANRSEKILRPYDQEIVGKLQEMGTAKGIKYRLNAPLEKIVKNDDGTVTVHFKDGGEPQTADVIMVATGRVPKSGDMGLEEAGVKLDKSGAVVVGDDNRSNIDSIYAVGDVTNRVQLTPVAIREGHAFADSVFGGNPRTISYDNIPSAVFSSPPIAAVGLTEDAAREKFGDDIKVYKSDFRPMKNVVSGREERGLYKMITQGPDETVVGLHMIGPESSEILQGAAVAVVGKMPKKVLDDVVAIHPSMAEELVLFK